MNDADSGQEDILAFLEGGALGARPRRVDTHAARIFLTPERAWKMKRAVAYDYLDFSSAEKRRAALEAELRLNRAIAPELYLGLHAVTRGEDGGLALDGEGKAVDWLLEMRRFADDALLSDMAGRGALTDALLTSLADRVAAMHERAEMCGRGDGAERIGSVIAGNRRAMERHADLLPPEAVARLTVAQLRLVERHGPLLEARGRTGHIRRCHGDLHLANIALVRGAPTPFDCLEFDDDLATIDTLYDLAFLLMDLWRRGLRRAANSVFNRYMDIAPHEEAGTPLLPLFLSARAGVRAHVAAAAAQEGEARTLLALSEELLETPAPRLVAVGGLSGTGKSTLARAIGGDFLPAPGARILRTDVIRKQIAGIAPETRLPASAYTREASLRVYTELEARAAALLRLGWPVIADGVFAKRKERRAIADTAGDERFDGLWLEADMQARLSRVDARSGDASDADRQVAEAQAAIDPGEIAPWHRLDADDGVERMREQALRLLNWS